MQLQFSNFFKFVSSDIDKIKKIIKTGAELLGKLIVGLCELGGKLLGFAGLMFEEIDSTLRGIEWGKIGVAIVEGICSGMLDCDFVLADYLGDFGENWLIGIQDIFDINSPSKLMKDEVGKYLALGVGEGFAENADGIGQQISDAVSEWTSLLPEKSQKSADLFAENTVSVFGGLPSEIAEYLEKSLDVANRWGVGISDTGKNTAEKFVETLTSNIGKLPEISLKILNETSGRFRLWGADFTNYGGRISSEFVSKVLSGISGLPSQMNAVGKNLVYGLWNGVSGNSGWLRGRIYDFGNEIMSDFRSVFGIHSPSAVMRDSVGKYLAQGIGVGFSEEIPDIADTALNAFENVNISAPEIDFSKIKNLDLRLDIAETELPKIEFSVSEIPEIESPEVLFDVPKIDVPELEIIAPEIETPDLLLDVVEIKPPEIPEIESPELLFDVPKIDVPELEITAPNVEFPAIETPDLSLDIAEIDLPELEISVPEIEVPDLKIKSVMPESESLPVIENSAVQALENQRINSGFIQPSATSEITNNVYNYSSSTTNNNRNISENPQNIVLNAQFVVGDEIVAEGVTNIIADKIDEHQGVKIQLRKRGLAR